MSERPTPDVASDGADRETLELWYALSRLYTGAASTRNRSARLGFTVTLVSGALLLLSTPLFGTDWAGAFAPLIPVSLGLVFGFGMFFGERIPMRRRESGLGRALRQRGLDARRPGSRGLAAYYDAQLILIRSEYEYLLEVGSRRSARLLEDSFGFAPEDPFGAGPLDVRPDTPEMAALRERWEGRMSAGRRGRSPALGLREDVAYRVFPREMTVQAERVVREGYLTISRSLIKRRYGRSFGRGAVEGETKKNIERDLEEYFDLTGKRSG